MRRGFTIIELMVVVAVVAIVGAIAAPSIRAIITRKGEIQASGGAHVTLNVGRDTAYKQLECVGVTTPSNTLTLTKWPCGQPPPPDAGAYDAGFTIVDVLQFDTDYVRQAQVLGTPPLVFEPSGGLTTGSGPRVVQVDFRSGRRAYFEISPAIGSIRECRSINFSGGDYNCVE
jgi:prepilin-type N-terminal cleavage/methylation domain-containing protein